MKTTPNSNIKPFLIAASVALAIPLTAAAFGGHGGYAGCGMEAHGGAGHHARRQFAVREHHLASPTQAYRQGMERVTALLEGLHRQPLLGVRLERHLPSLGIDERAARLVGFLPKPALLKKLSAHIDLSESVAATS